MRKFFYFLFRFFYFRRIPPKRHKNMGLRRCENPYLSTFHVLTQETRHRLRQLIIHFAGSAPLVTASE